jgi:hypothetical protein
MMKKILVTLLAWTLSLTATAPNPHDPKYDWMDELIEKNFEPFNEGITQESIEATSYSHVFAVRLKVLNNQIFVIRDQDNNLPNRGGRGAVVEMLDYLAKTYGLPDLDLLYYINDGIEKPVRGGAPIFCSSKYKEISQGIYFIDWYTIFPRPEWDSIVERINSTLSKLTWEEKIPKLVWRGAATDGFYSPSNWINFPRGKLCYLAIQNPEQIDAIFTDIYPWHCENLKKMKLALPLGNQMSYETQVQFKFQIILDGVFTTYPGDRWRLLSDSCCFMPESPYGHWFHDALIPWVHYVPVKRDLSDLVEKMDYLLANDEIARNIAKNARQFALDFLLSPQIAVYCYKALLKYASLQKYTPN